MTLEHDSASHYDVIIVGAGLGGSAMAYALKDSNLRILMLERGGYLRQEKQNWEPDEVITNHRYDPDERWFDESGQLFAPRIYYNVGGSSKFFGAVALRLRASDFCAHDYPDGTTVAWPITYRDLEPYYDQAEHLMWVHGQVGADATEPPCRPYPSPPLAHEPPIAWLAGRLAAQGLTPLPLPMAIDQGPGGRCRKGSPCDGFPCKIRAKGDGENSFLRPAMKKSNKSEITVVTGARVTKLLTNETGDRIAGVAYSDVSGEMQTVSGRLVVLAAGAANSAAILLRSASETHPNGVANGSDQVGRNFMAHNNTVVMAFSPFRKNPTRFQKTLCFNDFYGAQPGDAPGRGTAGAPIAAASGRADAAVPRGHIQMRGKVVANNLKESARPLVRLFARAIAARSFDFWVMSEDLPDPGNRVQITTEGRIRLSRRLNNLGPHRALVRELTRKLRRIGLWFVIEREPSPRTIQHQCGTLRMGVDPATSVLNPQCRAHEIENLYVADGSIFPSSSAVNPALTIAANALRVGTIVRDRLVPRRSPT